jgi:tetratricopeptide (TPR) repeat protein
MKILAWMLLLLFSAHVIAEDSAVEINKASESKLFAESYSLYNQGRYLATIEELNQIGINNPSNTSKTFLGLIAYWKGLCFNRTKDYENAILEFSKALGLDYSPLDLNYEYGQALFAADKLSEARLQFRESLRKKFKRAVSLYYIAFLSKELGDKKKAITFFKAINKLDPTEAQEVKQASEFQIGDIYLEQVEKHPDAFRAIEESILPQYQLAHDLDPDSALAIEILRKIRTLQAKYDLVLFKLRNGRPTLMPPYFLRAAVEYGVDSNVTFSPKEQEVSAAQQSSAFGKADVIGRYTFYHRDFLSISPEFRFNSTKYFSQEADIYRNDNFLLAPALRTAYEHHLWKKPASVLFDYDYNEVRRDIDSERKLKFASRSHTLMLGERFNYFNWGESIVRLRRRMFESYSSIADSTTTSLVVEQIRNLDLNTLLFYASYDMMRVKDNYYDTNAFTFRTDYILSRFRDYFTPSFGLGITRTTPLNNSVRGTEYLLNPSMRFSKTFKKSWRGNLKFDYQDYNSEDSQNYAYKKYTYSFELEYLF